MTLRSSKAVGKYRLTLHRKAIETILVTQAKRWDVTIYERSINSNHIHLAIRSKSRLGLQNFFRTIGALIARTVTGAKKGNPFGKFWDEVVWTRIVEWGKAFITLVNYVKKNILESTGTIPYLRFNQGLRLKD